MKGCFPKLSFDRSTIIQKAKEFNQRHSSNRAQRPNEANFHTIMEAAEAEAEAVSEVEAVLYDDARNRLIMIKMLASLPNDLRLDT